MPPGKPLRSVEMISKGEKNLESIVEGRDGQC